MAADGPRIQRPHRHKPNIARNDDTGPTFAPLRKSHLSAPQLSLLSDRTRLRRLKHAKGAWQQVPRIEDPCHTHVSHTSGSTTQTRVRAVSSRRTNTLPMCKGDPVTHTWAFGQCRPCGSFLDSQLEHGETCSPAEATRGHYACSHAVLEGQKLVDPGITPQNPEDSQSRPAYLFTTAAVLGRSAAQGRVCGILQCSSGPRGRRRSSFRS